MKEKERRLLTVICFLLLFMPVFSMEDAAENTNEDVLKKLLDVKINTASKYSQTLNQAPASVSIITSEEIERFGCRTLDDIIMKIRGFYISNDHNYSYIGMRGFSRPSDYNNRVLILINGVSMSENVYGSSFSGSEFGLDMDAIERIEIVRGPSSSLYGTNAMLAVINVITKDGKSEDGIKTTLQIGNFGKIQAGIKGGKELKNGLDFFVSAHIANIKGQDYYFEEFDTPATNNGIANDIDRDRYDGIFAVLKYKNFSLQGMMASRKKQIPTASFETIFNDPREKTYDSQRSIELKYSKDITYNTKITLREYFGSYFYKGAYPYNIPEYTTLQEDQSKGHWFGFEGQFGWDIRADNRLIVGAEYKNNSQSAYKYWDEFGTPFDKNVPFQQWSLYIQDELQIQKNISFTLSARYDKFSDRGKALSPRAAIIYNPFHSTTLKLLYGNAFRAPNFYEIYYEVQDEAKSNPDIKGEKIRTFEAVVEHRFSKEIFGALSIYKFEFVGLIEQVVDPTDNLLQFQNFQKVKSKGIEAELNMRLKNGFIGYINFNYQESKSPITQTGLTNSPSFLAKSGLSIPLFTHLFASAELFYESGRLTVYDTKTKSFLLANLHLLTQTLFDRFKFSLHVKNLFGAKYSYPGGYEHAQHSLIQPGHSITLKIEYTPYK